MNPATATSLNRFLLDRRYWVIPLAFWALAACTSYFWYGRSIEARVEALATNQGRFIFKMVEAMRLWNARHGGVYVLVDKDSRPNPYLDIPERDVVTTHGHQLTLVNPAYMTRQLGLALSQEAQIELHLTSLKPLNPSNAPDEWESVALTLFENASAVRERMEIMEQRGQMVARYIGALPTRHDCLQCHEKQGYRLGDIRGGISVAFSIAPYMEAARSERLLQRTVHGVAWLLLSLLTVFFLDQLRRGMLLLIQAEQQQNTLVQVRTRELAREAYERKQAELQLRRLMDASAEGIYGIDAEGLCNFCNPVACRLLGLKDSSEILGKQIHATISGGNPEVLTNLESYRLGIATHSETDSFRRSDGSFFHAEWRSAPIYFDSRLMGAVVTFQDITERQRSQAQVWMKANHDALTGLPNRSLFHDRLEQAMLRVSRRSAKVGLLFIDLDGFKAVNDTLGHEAGDALLKEAAHRLTACVRESDTAARLGGDEFTVILTAVDQRADIEQVGQKILHSLAQPYHLGTQTARVSCSIGAAIYPADALTLTAFIHAADQAMYRAKQGGKNTLIFAEPLPPDA